MLLETLIEQITLIKLQNKQLFSFMIYFKNYLEAHTQRKEIKITKVTINKTNLQ